MALNFYVILDAARMGARMYEAKGFNIKHESLFIGRKEQVLPEVAPYLFEFDQDSFFGNWLKKEGWGKSWGIYISSKYNFKEVHRHLRRFLKVKTEEGKSLYFRFYDPRVLRVILPTYDTKQLTLFFDKINGVLVEDEENELDCHFFVSEEKLKFKKTKRNS